ncbi:MAG: DUF5777 family beta-barrel protein [Fibrobacterota bacterium]
MKSSAHSKFLFILLLLAVAPIVGAHPLNPDPDTYVTPDRLFGFFLPNTVPQGVTLLTIDHRASAPAFDNPLEDGFGLDNGGFKIGLGLRHGFLDNLDAGFRRTNGVWENYDTYEGDIRYRLQREERRGVDLSLLCGFTWFYIPHQQDASGFYAGLSAGKSFARWLYLSTGFLAHTSSSYKIKPDTAEVFSVAVPIGLHLALNKGMSLVAESTLPIAGYSAGYPSWACGLKFQTFNHTFSFFLSTTQYFTPDGIVCGSDRGANPMLGFLITRQFGQ